MYSPEAQAKGKVLLGMYCNEYSSETMKMQTSIKSLQKYLTEYKTFRMVDNGMRQVQCVPSGVSIID